jgi:hypothetical protein
MQRVIIKSSILAAASAVHVDQSVAPDVYGPNGNNYTNTGAEQDMARIKIDINQKGDGKGDVAERCSTGKWAKVSIKGYLKNGQQVIDTDASGGD